MDKMFDVSESVVVVSGGSRGIGLAIAEEFAMRGAQTVITGRTEASLVKATKAISQRASNIGFQVCNVTDPIQIATCVSDTIEKHGRIDTWINCAGINIRKPVLEFTQEDYDAIMDTNLRGAFFATQEVGRAMVDQKGGAIINIDSLSSLSSLPHVAPYGMAKAGLSSMTRAMATELGRHGVRVNGIAPGFILTDLIEKL